jgi:predicted hotdog family 3-hydroxylacyl-ACP dehydratase
MNPDHENAAKNSAKLGPVYPIAELIPQSGRMCLLDSVVEVGEKHIVAELTVREDGLFSDAEGMVPAWVGMEYMAQTIAAFSGYQRKCRGLAIDLGFLLGTRGYECSPSRFPCGSRLRVSAEKVMDGINALSAFDCKIEGEAIHAFATINVFTPQDSKAFLAAKNL